MEPRPTLLVLPLSNLPGMLVEFIASTLAEAFPDFEVFAASEAMLPPMKFYDWSRAQYRSELIVSWLAEIRARLGVDYLLGVGDIDAYADGLNFVFGEAYPEGRVAAVYLRRLHPSFYGEPEDTELFLSRVKKEVIHEMGHVFGLEHCRLRQCVMSFSNSVIEVDAKTWKFCRLCASKLERRGVRVSPEYVLDAP